MNILIAEDNDSMRAYLHELVSTLTEEVTEAATGVEAVARYRDDKPDIVLMDIQMPVMDGIEATRRILRIDPAAVVVIVTEYDVPSYRRDAQLAGARDYILKENLHELIPKLTAMMNLN